MGSNFEKFQRSFFIKELKFSNLAELWINNLADLIKKKPQIQIILKTEHQWIKENVRERNFKRMLSHPNTDGDAEKRDLGECA
jgi:hypothetical protein